MEKYKGRGTHRHTDKQIPDLKQSGRHHHHVVVVEDCGVRIGFSAWMSFICPKNISQLQTIQKWYLAMVIVDIFCIYHTVQYVLWRQRGKKKNKTKKKFFFNQFFWHPVAVCLTEPLSGRLLMAMTAERMKALSLLCQCEHVPWPVASSSLPGSALPSLLIHQGLIVVALCALASLHSGRPLIHIQALHRAAAVH